MLHTLGRPARPVVTGERWGRGSEPYGLCIRAAYTDACASLRDGSGVTSTLRGAEGPGGRSPSSSPGSGVWAEARPPLFTLEHSAGCAGKPDTRLSVHVPSSLTIPRHTAACPARAYSWGGSGPGGPSLAAQRPCMSTAPASPQTAVPGGPRRTQESGCFCWERREGGGLGEEQSPAARGPRACLLTTPLLGWSRALWGKGSDGLGFVF